MRHPVLPLEDVLRGIIGAEPTDTAVVEPTENITEIYVPTNPAPARTPAQDTVVPANIDILINAITACVQKVPIASVRALRGILPNAIDHALVDVGSPRHP